MTFSEENLTKITTELEGLMKRIDPEEIGALAENILHAKSIFVMGAGRTRLMLMAFAMRLMQIGFPVYVVGEVVTPAIQEGDLLLIGSGSGETGGVVLNANKAKKLGARVFLITTKPESSLGKIADQLLCIPTSTGKAEGPAISLQPGGSTFEQALFLISEGIILYLLDQSKAGMDVMTRHANLE